MCINWDIRTQISSAIHLPTKAGASWCGPACRTGQFVRNPAACGRAATLQPSNRVWAGRASQTCLTTAGMLCNRSHDFGCEVREIGGVDHAHRGGAWAEHGDACSDMESDGLCGQERMRDAFRVQIFHSLHVQETQ